MSTLPMSAFIPPIPVTPRHSTTRHQSARRTSTICAANKTQQRTPPATILQNIQQRLQKQLPTLFSSTPDYSIYSPQVAFEDPLNRFRGISKYASNINFLNSSPVFSHAHLTLHHTAIINSDTVRTRWTLSMVVNLPWTPCVAFTGQSDYVVDLVTARVIRHYDYWDSLKDSTFFSLPALLDLLAQCRPHIGPRDLAGFQLLRRTSDFQIRKFTNPIFLRETNDSRIETWQPAQDGHRLSYVAVLVLQNSPRDDADVLEQANKLRHFLKGKSYVTLGDKFYYVPSKLRGQVFHEVWLQLSHATAFVDT